MNTDHGTTHQDPTTADMATTVATRTDVAATRWTTRRTASISREVETSDSTTLTAIANAGKLIIETGSGEIITGVVEIGRTTEGVVNTDRRGGLGEIGSKNTAE